MRTQTQLISNPKDLYRFLASPGIEVAKLVFTGKSICWLSWRHSDDAHAPMLRHTKDVLASYVTAGERMHLYSYLDTLQKRALYRHGQRYLYSTKRWRGTGECWGLPGLKQCEYISEFVSGGPKN